MGSMVEKTPITLHTSSLLTTVSFMSLFLNVNLDIQVKAVFMNICLKLPVIQCGAMRTLTQMYSVEQATMLSRSLLVKQHVFPLLRVLE